MATVPKQQRTREIKYPTRDGKPMAETELHMEDMIDTIQVLRDHFADRPNVYVWGNLLLYYEEGNPRKHVSPDVLVGLRAQGAKSATTISSGRRGEPLISWSRSPRNRPGARTRRRSTRFIVMSCGCPSISCSTRERITSIPRSRVTAWWAGTLFASIRSPAGCRARFWASTSSVTAQDFVYSIPRPEPGCRPGANEPSFLIAAPRRNAAAPRLRKPLSSISPRKRTPPPGARGPATPMTASQTGNSPALGSLY